MKIKLNTQEKISYGIFATGLGALGIFTLLDMPLVGLTISTILCTFATINYIGTQVKRSKLRTPLKQ